MTSQTQHIPPEEWRTLILETNESRLFRNITQKNAKKALKHWTPFNAHSCGRWG